VAELTGFPNCYENLPVLAASCPSGTSNTNPADPPTSLREISRPLHAALIKNPLVCLTLCLHPRIASEPLKIPTLNALSIRLKSPRSIQPFPSGKLVQSIAQDFVHCPLDATGDCEIVSQNPSGQHFHEDHTPRAVTYTSLALSVSKQPSCRHHILT
jgi:hypothetical protein